MSLRLIARRVVAHEEEKKKVCEAMAGRRRTGPRCGMRSVFWKSRVMEVCLRH